MRILIASDHAGFNLKKSIAKWLDDRGYDFADIGVDNGEAVVDYPDYAFKVAEMIVKGEYERGILVCGSGQGMAMAANRVPGIRAAVCQDVFTAQQSRAHNDANVLCLGERVVSPSQIPQILDTWLNTPFEGGRHARRIAKLEERWSSIAPTEPPLIATEVYRPYRFGIALSPNPTRFGPILFAGNLEDGIKFAANYGFDAIEISIRSVQDICAERLSKVLRERNLSIAAFATGQACLEDNLCLCSSDPSVVRHTVHHLKTIIDLAAQFQAMAIIGGIRGRLTGNEREMARQKESAIRAIRECAHYAGSKGVTLLIEPINRYETNFINTSKESLELLAEIGEPCLKVLLDTFHMNIEEQKIDQALFTCREHLGYIHIADNHRRAPGQGHIHFEHIFQTLARIGYQGYLTAEILPYPDDQTAIRLTADFLKPYQIKAAIEER